MPLTYDQLSAITDKKWIPKLQDSIFDSDPLLQRAMKTKNWVKMLDGGASIMVPLNYALNTAGGWYTGAETLSTTDNDVITSAEYQWKQLYENITLSGLDELKNAGDSAIIDLAKSKVQIAEKTMKDRLGDGLYSAGTDAKSIVGLRVVVDNANTVGGIDQSSYSWWQSQENGTDTTLSLAVMQTMHNSLCINSDKPSVVMATRTLYNKYWGLLQPQQRFMDSDTAKGGFDNVMFNGIPVIAGSKVPASHMFFLNEDYLSLWIHKERNFKFRNFEQPINQDVRVAKVLFAGAFGTDNCRMHGKFTALTA